jgi:proteasome lid subunit RPN8/RPN11
MSESGKFAVWQAPRCAWTVEYPPALMEQVRRQVLEAFFAVPRGGAEAGGVLYGSRDGQRVRITAFRALECEHRSGPAFTLSPADHARLAELVASPGDLTVAVGWYHSHTRSEIFLSPEDLALHDRYFPEPWQLALVLRPGAMVTRAGFFVRDADGILKTDASPLEFVVKPLAVGEETAALRAAGGAGEGENLHPPSLPTSIPPLSPSPAARRAASPPLPAAREAASPHRIRRIALWLLALTLTAVALFMRPSPPPAPVALAATAREGRLEIRWNAEAPAVREAVAAKLEITDGRARPSTTLTQAQLRSGGYPYVRESERVDVRLVLERRGGRRTQEAVTFLGPPVRSPEALEKELHRARTELLNQAMKIQALERTLNELKSAKKRSTRPAPAAVPTSRTR